MVPGATIDSRLPIVDNPLPWHRIASLPYSMIKLEGPILFHDSLIGSSHYLLQEAWCHLGITLFGSSTARMHSLVVSTCCIVSRDAPSMSLPHARFVAYALLAYYPYHLALSLPAQPKLLLGIGVVCPCYSLGVGCVVRMSQLPQKLQSSGKNTHNTFSNSVTGFWWTL